MLNLPDYVISRHEIHRATAIGTSDQLAPLACWPELRKAGFDFQEVRWTAAFPRCRGEQHQRDHFLMTHILTALRSSSAGNRRPHRLVARDHLRRLDRLSPKRSGQRRVLGDRIDHGSPDFSERQSSNVLSLSPRRWVLSAYCRNRVSRMSRGYSTSASGSASSGKVSRSDSAPVPTPTSTASPTATTVQQRQPASATNSFTSDAPSSTPKSTLQSKLPDHVAVTAIAPPRTFIDRLPKALLPIKPYLELIRIDKPIGTWLLFWPCGK
jgi:hypothetical protein